MTTRLIAALIAIAFVSACNGVLGGPPPAPVFGGTYSDSVGFTGIDGEGYIR
jgi:hypothetical protein